MRWPLSCTNPEPTPKESGCNQEDPGPFLEAGPAPVVEAGPICQGETPVATPLNVLGAHVVAGTADADMLEDLDAWIAYFQTIPGPWNKPLTGPYRSENGLTFRTEGKTVLGCGSVPDVVEGPDGRLWMVYVDTDLQRMRERARAHRPLRSGWAGVGGLGMAVSEDGREFHPVAMEIQGEVPLYVVDPDLVAREDGSYDLYFFGVPADRACADVPDPVSSAGPHTVYRATSRDLQQWSLIGPVWSPQGGSDPGVWCEGETCYLWMNEGARSTDGGQSFSAFDFGPSFLGNLVNAATIPEGFQGYAFGERGLMAMRSSNGARWTILGPTNLDLQSVAAIYRDGEIWLY